MPKLKNKLSSFIKVRTEDTSTEAWVFREKMGWVWAVYEAANGWDAFDQYLVEMAKTRGLVGEELSNFAYFYQVARTLDTPKAAAHKNKKKYDVIADYANKKLRGRLSDPQDLRQAYRKFVSFLQKYEAGNDKRAPHIFAAKMLWFYQPKDWFMFDRRSIETIKHYFGKRKTVTPETFQTEAEEIFHKGRLRDIRRLMSALGVSYAYPKRVVDKYLYLRGGPMSFAEGETSKRGLHWLRATQWNLDQQGVDIDWETIDDLVTRLIPMAGS